MTDTKRCAKCKVDKEFTEFGKCTKAKTGLQSRCRLCRSTYRDGSLIAKVVHVKGPLITTKAQLLLWVHFDPTIETLYLKSDMVNPISEWMIWIDGREYKKQDIYYIYFYGIAPVGTVKKRSYKRGFYKDNLYDLKAV